MVFVRPSVRPSVRHNGKMHLAGPAQVGPEWIPGCQKTEFWADIDGPKPHPDSVIPASKPRRIAVFGGLEPLHSKHMRQMHAWACQGHAWACKVRGLSWFLMDFHGFS